jgi:hypothetical protein
MRAKLHSFWQTSVRCGQHFGACLGIIAFAFNAEPLCAASPAPAEATIKVNTETKAQADAVLRALFNLEKQQSNKNTAAVDELRAKLVKAASGSPFVELKEWDAYTAAWAHLLAQRGSRFQENTTANRSDERSSALNLGGKVEAKQGAQVKLEKQDPTVNVEKSVRASGEAGFQNSTSQKENANTTTEINGSMGDPSVLKEKARSLNALLSKIRQLGFHELVNQKELVGFWTWNWSGGPGFAQASVLLELQPDGKLLARFAPPANLWPNLWAQQVWGGTWSVSEGKLSAQITGYWTGLRSFVTAEDAQRHQRFFPVELKGELIPKRTITFGNQDRMILDGERDNTMERVKREKSILQFSGDGKLS